jgi:hypothetical protein
MSVHRWLADIRGLGRVVELRWGLGRDTSVSVRHAPCGRMVFNQDLGKRAAPRSATTRRCIRYVLRRLMIDRTTVSAIAVELGVSWHTVNTIAMGATAALVAARAPPGWPE